MYPDGLCDPGYYCDGGDDTPTPMDKLCWPGHFCEVGSVLPELCPNGTYQYSNGSDACDDCPAGYYCDPVECKHQVFLHQICQFLLRYK